LISARYTGEACAVPLANPQGGKATCFGDPQDKSPVKFEDKDGKIIFNPPSVNLGEVVTMKHQDGKFSSDTELIIKDMDNKELQKLKIHTSCSQQLEVGDVFGSLLITDLCAEGDTGPAETCDDLGGKPGGIEFQFIGGSCSCADTTNLQEGKATCDGTAGPEPVVVTSSNGYSIAPPSVFAGETFTATDPEGKEFDSDSYFKVGGQSLKIHTSCSKPLAVDDVFGCLKVVKLFRPTSRRALLRQGGTFTLFEEGYEVELPPPPKRRALRG
jgi:hypothetical protein